MVAKNLKCLRCGLKLPLAIRYNCPECNGILEIDYKYEKLSKDNLFEKAEVHSIWKYKKLLPIRDYKKIISLAEGNTPLFKSSRLGGKIGNSNLYIKDETRNPTGSFKDRPISVAISKANEDGTKIVITSSSGNAGASMAAYAAKGNMKSIVIVSSATPSNKVLQIGTYGATLIRIKGDSSDCFRLAKMLSMKFDWVNLTSTYINPFATEGDKTVAYEIFEQLGRKAPDWILIPVGTGPLLFGCYKGFIELKRFGLVSSLPSMVCVQAQGCAPIVRAFEKSEVEVKEWSLPETVASGIADPLKGYAQDGTLTLETVRKSGGVAVAVSDKEILKGVSMLAKLSGIFAEPTGAASIAGAEKLIRKGVIKKKDSVVCVVTGSGFKDLTSLYNNSKSSQQEVQPELEEVEKMIRKKGLLKSKD